MKKGLRILSAALVLILSMSLWGCVPPSESFFTADGFQLAYLVRNKNEYSVLAYFGEETEITIPLEYEGKPVVRLGITRFQFKITPYVKKITFQRNIKEPWHFNLYSGYVLIDGELKDAKDENGYWIELQLEEICVMSDNAHMKAVDGVLFSRDGKELLLYPPARANEKYVLPETVTELSSYGTDILSHKHLKELYIPSGTIVELRDYMKLDSIYVPASLLEEYQTRYTKSASVFKQLPEDWESMV